jgi:membrane protease YdiL (CAAX protease family)
MLQAMMFASAVSIPNRRAGTATADRLDAAARAAAATTLLTVAVAARWQMLTSGTLGGVAEGSLFGASLLAAAWLAGIRPSRPRSTALAAGLAAGLILTALPLLARWPWQPLSLGPAAPFWQWAAATTLVATAEELLLRGAIWRWTTAAGGDMAALLATTILFALMHVPVYGTSVVPLDLGVGLFLGGLRLWFGGTAAPAVAHVVADLATWWP